MDDTERIRQLERELDAARKLAARYAGEAAGLRAGALPSAVEDLRNRGGAELDVRNGALVVVHPTDRGVRNVTVDGWVKEVHTKSPHLFGEDGEQGDGTGAGTGNSGTNPWAKETWNLTEQGRLVRDNPALAKQMAAQAGVTLDI